MKDANSLPWRCFHCNDVFHDAQSAREHFGPSEYQEPACQIDIKKFREMECRDQRHAEEDTELHRIITGMRSDIDTALRREEEKGYARGLQDAWHIAPDGYVLVPKVPTMAMLDAGGQSFSTKEFPFFGRLIRAWQDMIVAAQEGK